MTASQGVPAPVARALAVLSERRPEWYRLLRFGAVSAVVTPTTLMILWGLHALAGWSPWQANALAVSAGAVPAYVLNRYWVWHRRGPNRLWGEVLPFWALALLGGAASTAAVEAAGRWDNTGLLVLVNLGTYGTLWLLKFAVLDRVVWPAGRSQRARDRRRPAGVHGS